MSDASVANLSHALGVEPSQAGSLIQQQQQQGSSVVKHLPLVLEVPGSIPARGEKNFGVRTTLSLVSFARMTLDKCIVLRIGTLTGCPLCRESHPLCSLKNPMVIEIWLLVGFHPATRSVQSTPADNTRKRVWQYIKKERKSTLFQLYRDGSSWVEPVLS